MCALEHVLERMGLSMYLSRLQHEGFDTWETLMDITEEDLNALDVKLGHRRKLQRAISKSKVPTASTAQVDGESDDRIGDTINQNTSSNATRAGQPADSGEQKPEKRKYVRRPRKDLCAPKKPPSAYVVFSNELRDSYEPKLQFNVFTKLVGERWQALDPTEKEHRELIAQQQKETYHKTLAEYKKTPEYAAHHAYVTGWKLKDRQTKAGAIDGKHVPIDGKRRRIDDAAYDGTSLANDDYDDDDEDDDFDDNRPPDRLSALSSPKMTSTTVRGPVFQDRYGARSPLPSESQQHTKVLYTQERASIIDGNSLVRSPRDPRPVAAEPSVYNQSSMRLPSFRPINRHDNEDFFDARARNTYHQPTDPRPSHDLETRLERTRSAMVDGRPPESWAKQPFTLPPLERHMSHPSPSNLFLPPPSGLTTEKMQDGIPQSAARDQVSASVSASTYALGNAARRPSMLVEATSSSSAISALSALSARSGYQPSAADGRGPPAFREKNAVSDHYEPTGPSTAFRPLSPVDGRVDGIHSAYHHTRESNGRSPSSASRRMSSRSDLADSV